MAGLLTDARQDLAAALEDDASALPPVYPVMPEHITPPAVVITPSADWVTPVTFAEIAVGLDVIVIEPGTNEIALDAIESDVNEIIGAVSAHGWGLGKVSEPYPLAINGTQVLACAVTVNL